MPDVTYTKHGAIRWGADAVGKIDWDPENKTGEASVTDEVTGTVYPIGESGGGGGEESDFSTATVTFLNSLGEGDRSSYDAACISVESDGIEVEVEAVARNAEVTFTVPLYKGKITIPAEFMFVGDLDADIMPQVTGNAEFSNANLVITGDCTINAAGFTIE